MVTATRPAPVRPPDATPTVLSLPALVSGEVRHERFHPVRHAFTYRAHLWLVDADEPQVLPRPLRFLARFEARDHLGSAEHSIGDNVRRFLSTEGVAWEADRIAMLANARTLGYVFDPLTVYWCYDRRGRLEGVLAEVHNTYGERHAYVVELDERSAGRVDKELYVSPFFGVFGDYQLKFVLAADKVGAFVTLRQDDRVVFTGSFVGVPRAVSARSSVGVALTRPLMPQRVSALIRLHGVRLWLRRLPVVRRRPHPTQRGMR